MLPAVEPLLAAHRVPGASLALLADGEVVEVRAAGHCTAGGDAPVTPATIFQVGSVSKLVTAVGALALVRRGQLQLDADVNAYLKGWQLPADRPVSLRATALPRRRADPDGQHRAPAGRPRAEPVGPAARPWRAHRPGPGARRARPGRGGTQQPLRGGAAAHGGRHRDALRRPDGRAGLRTGWG